MKLKLSVDSEIGNLKGVIIHTPGTEVENMTPKNAERALYSDILNLNVASGEYSQLSGVLKKVTTTYEVKELLAAALESQAARTAIISYVSEGTDSVRERLESLDSESLAGQLIEGFRSGGTTLQNTSARKNLISTLYITSSLPGIHPL
ncbi:MAG: hypothetical protein R2727_09845 [Bacteroidales bacterium]